MIIEFFAPERLSLLFTTKEIFSKVYFKTQVG